MYRQVTQGAFKESALDLIRFLEKKQAKAAGKTKDDLAGLDNNASTPVDFQDLFLRLSLDAFGKMTFGIDFQSLGSELPDEFGAAFDFLTNCMDGRVANPLWSETPEVRANRPQDLLDHFITFVTEEGQPLSDTDLRDVFVNFMIAGRDTTAQALSWQFYMLMTNPDVMSKLRQEIDTVLDGVDTYTYEMIMNDLPYMKAVFHETLRLHAPVPRSFKEAVEDDQLPGGIRVSKGDIICMSPYSLARSTKVWGDDAEEFVPERWLVDAPALTDRTSPFGKFKTVSPSKTLSFNAGPRLCIGQTFATLEVMVTTVMLLKRFEIHLVPGQPTPTYKQSITLPMAHPLYVTVTDRVI
ncbi:Protein kinase alk2 [Podila epigama]|nr:Protein kinase alk2 [Podila epigama]